MRIARYEAKIYKFNMLINVKREEWKNASLDVVTIESIDRWKD